MFKSLEFLIAYRYLRSKRKEGFISVIAVFSFVGIMLGVATLIIVMSVMNGFREELVDRILGINAHITVYAKDRNIENYDEKVEGIKQLYGIKSVNPLVEGQVMATADGQATGALVKGIRQEDLGKKELIADNISNHALDKFTGKDVVIMGNALGRSLRLEAGDSVKLIAPETNATIVGSIPRMKTYTVIGFFESGMYEYDSSTIFMPLEAAQIHFKYNNAASALEVMLNNVEDANWIAQNIRSYFYDKGENMSVVDWQQANSSFIGALKVERNVMFIILTLIILVAAFNIISSLIMLVNDKAKNIALLRTMGMTKSSVMRIFFLCGATIGFMGTMIGLVLGIAFATNIRKIESVLEAVTGTNLFDPTVYFLSNLPSKVFASDVIMIVLMSLGLSFLATLYPAYKATKSQPAEILRYE